MKEHTGHRQVTRGKRYGSQANSVLNSVKTTLRERIRYMNKRKEN